MILVPEQVPEMLVVLRVDSVFDVVRAHIARRQYERYIARLVYLQQTSLGAHLMKSICQAHLLLALFSVTVGAGDWASWRGPNHDGISSEKGWNPEGLAGGAKVVWQAQVGNGYSAVAVTDGKVFTLGNDGEKDTVFCMDAGTGQVAWTYAYACSRGGGYKGPRATPVLDGPAVFTYSQDGQLHCLKAADGSLMWKKNLSGDLGANPPKWNHAGSPLVLGQMLILNAGSRGVALKKQTGEVIWGGDPGTCGYASPVPFKMRGKQAVAIFGQKELMAIDAVSGKVLWQFPWQTRYDVNAADPVIIGDSMFISSGYGRGCALLDFSGGKPRKVWENKNMSNHFSSSVALDGHIYGIDGNAGRGNLKCLEAAGGDQVWSHNTGFGSLICADGKLIILNDSGKLMIVEASPRGYKQLSSAQTPLSKTCWTMPILCDGLLYCRNDKGHLVCVDLR